MEFSGRCGPGSAGFTRPGGAGAPGHVGPRSEAEGAAPVPLTRSTGIRCPAGAALPARPGCDQHPGAATAPGGGSTPVPGRERPAGREGGRGAAGSDGTGRGCPSEAARPRGQRPWLSGRPRRTRLAPPWAAWSVSNEGSRGGPVRPRSSRRGWRRSESPADCTAGPVGFAERATFGALQTEEWGQFMHICDVINATEEG